MRLWPITHLLALRYRLLWAQARTRRGKIALFLAGYVLVSTMLVLLGVGGFRAARMAVIAGMVERLGQVVLGSVYANAAAWSVLLSIGVNPAFTDAALRRFPITASERLFARHLTALLEPVWIIVLGVSLGLVVATTWFGISAVWLSAPAALLLIASNYLLARTIVLVVERAGPVALGIGVAVLALAPTVLSRTPAGRAAGLAGLSQTPPFAAAAILAGVRYLAPMLVLLAWCAALAAIVAALERRPPRSAAVANARPEWDSPYDRIAARFGVHAPLVGKFLRYYFRSHRVRVSFISSLPVFPLLFAMPAALPGSGALVGAIWLMLLTGAVGTFPMAMNVFGYDGPGFRRYFLMPAQAETVVRVASLAALAPAGLLVPFVLACRAVFSRTATDAATWVLIASSAVTGQFLYQTIAAWTALLAPRRAQLRSAFANNASRTATVVMIGCTMLPFAALMALDRTAGIGVLLRGWWIMPCVAAAVFLLYLFTLARGGVLMLRRRERILSAVEAQA